MKRSKDRLHSVVIVGANPAGIAAANKLGELGIPVTLVDREADLNQKLAAQQWRLPSGAPFNFAHRPGLLRILRNTGIHCMLPARVTGIKHSPQGFRVRIQHPETYVDAEQCVLCGRCAEVCPVITPDKLTPIRFGGRHALPGRPVIDKRKEPPCQSNCPLGVNVQAYVALARAGRFKEAFRVVREDNVLPGICSRICTHPCEEACRRGELDDPIAIRDIKRFLTDYEITQTHKPKLEKAPSRNERVAIIGSGPAGLAAAAELARLGYGLTVFEKEDKPGGLLRYGIGAHRLPRKILDYDLQYIHQLGVQFETSRPVDLQRDLPALKEDFQAVLATVGAWTDRKLGIPGEALKGVDGCLSVLTRLHGNEGKNTSETVEGKPCRVAVIGDGNAAFDLARTLVRQGDQVTLVSWFPEDLIPASPHEVQGAREEGVEIVDSARVISFEGENGRLLRLQCRPTRPGEPDADGIPWPVTIPDSDPFDMAFDRAVVAIGQMGPFADADQLEKTDPASGIQIGRQGCLTVDYLNRTRVEGLYAAGDGVTGPTTVVQAMASGRSAARSIHGALSREEMPAEKTGRPADRDYPEIPGNIPSLSRPTMPEQRPGVRKDNFSEVAMGLSEPQVLFEAERCLQCGICSECRLCADVCEAIGAIRHQDQMRETVEHAGVVIIADPSAAPPVKGEDVIRAYGPKAAKPDVNAMVARGFAAAAHAMILLEGGSQRPKGRGVSFFPPDPELSPEIRIGVFVCRCNDAFGWVDEMDRHVADLIQREDIVHAQVMTAACVPDGAAVILRTIREKGLTRVVLASCVCCPHDFICSACTDQRTRLKNALFRGTGISRAMVETCNLRGEVLRNLPDDPSGAVYSFKGLIGRSINRAKRLRPLPAPMRNYNFTTAVIGESEAAVFSAQALASSGYEVFMFGMQNKPLTKTLEHPNIHCFQGSRIAAIGGTLGDFQITVETGDFSQVMQVGAIILGEKASRRVPYVHQEGLPSTVLIVNMQKEGVPDIPFHYPGTTPISGLFLTSTPGIQISQRKGGLAAAVLAAAVMPRGPRQSKGFTVVVDEQKCRGCGRCIEICPYRAISFNPNGVGGWHAVVDEALCKGCGNCISICPSNAADSPYRNQEYLERVLEEVLLPRI
ncbi:MAG: FAD-dependent oxidoreductase [Deltaproteobacteria bacterium]|nr:FAD-dependent oxidoreductase [Deltaproteobacteria bacterium]